LADSRGGDLKSGQEASYCRGIRSGTSGLEAYPGVHVVVVVLVGLRIQGRREEAKQYEEGD
jgi:hypothetical protein